MSQQKAFYELPKPAKVIYTVSVLPDDPDTCKCSKPDCETNDDAHEYENGDIDVFQCDVCGLWFCVDHIKEVNKYDLCVDCADLPPGIRAMIETFRDELNK